MAETDDKNTQLDLEMYKKLNLISYGKDDSALYKSVAPPTKKRKLNNGSSISCEKKEEETGPMVSLNTSLISCFPNAANTVE